MNKTARIGIVAALLFVIGVTIALKHQNKEASRKADQPQAQVNTGNRPDQAQNEQDPTAKKALPRLVDLGAGKCIPCKMMAPILEELKQEYKGQMEVQFIDVWENRQAGQQYGIQAIPTQIFYDASGKERFRNIGFYSKKDILAKCEELGFNLKNREN